MEKTIRKISKKLTEFAFAALKNFSLAWEVMALESM
jgi:hypothetical protein